MKYRWERNPSDILQDGPHYNLQKHLAEVQKLHANYPWRDKDVCVKKVVDLIDYDTPECIAENAAEFLRALFENDDIFIFEKPTLQYSNYLRRIQKRLTLDHEPAFRAATRFLNDLYRLIPKGEGAFTLRLFDLVDPDDLIALCWCLYSVKHQDELLFPHLRNTLFNNMVRVSGHHPDTYDGKGKLIGPADCKLPPEQKIVAYLQDTPFHQLIATSVPFSIPQHTRFEHTHIVAGPGHGKTQTLQHLIAGDLTADQPPALVIIDSQGDLIRKIERLALFAPSAKLADRLVIIDPTDTKHPPALNLFDVDRSRFGSYDEAAREQIENGTIELYDYIFGSLLRAELTQKQSVIFRYLARLMLSIPNATIHDLVRLLQDPTPYWHHVEALPAGPRSFFQTEFIDKKEFGATKKQILRRLWGILEQPSFERMFTQPKNRIDMFDALNTGKIVLVNTAKDFLKAERSSLFGRTFIALTLQAALERAPIPEKERRPAFLIIDEAHEYFDQNIDELLTQARKYKVGLVLAHQYLDQLTPALRASLAATTSIKMAGGVSDKDARALAGDMRASPEFIAAQRKTDQQTTFATYVRNLTTSGAVSLSVPFFTLEGMATLSDAHHAELRDKNRARYTASATSASLTVKADRSTSQTTDTTTPDDDWRS